MNAYFSFLTHTKQFLLVTFSNIFAGLEVGQDAGLDAGRWTPYEWTGVNVEIVM